MCPVRSVTYVSGRSLKINEIQKEKSLEWHGVFQMLVSFGAMRVSNLVSRKQVAHFFAGVTRAGAASGASTGKNLTSAGGVDRAD
jgi:hypothetical protein